MPVLRILIQSLCLIALLVPVHGQDTTPPQGKEIVYKHTNGQPQLLEVFFPKDHDPATAKVPCMILFHGGGWGNGDKKTFHYDCSYFASRGIVAITANYFMYTKEQRLKLPKDVSRKAACATDAKSAIRWVKQHADELGIDPDKIIAGGGSAGGHISILSTTNPGLNDPADPKDIDTSVAAYVLFNPALSAQDEAYPEINALNYLTGDFGPAVVFFGTEDRWKKGWDVAAKQLQDLGAGKRVKVWLADGAEHAFFNKQPWKDLTLIKADKFLTSLGFLKGEPTLKPPAGAPEYVKESQSTADFSAKMGKAPVGGGFNMEDYWVWCGSVIKGEDGKYHMFASRWPKSLLFTPNWMTNSEVVRAVADNPEGPYTFAEVVLPARGKEYWDGMMTHNPTIHKAGDTYLLYYTGTTYDFPSPTPDTPVTDDQRYESNGNQRIGLATAPSVKGPWKRQDKPIIEPRPGEWDGFITTNPAPCVRDDGSILLIYKSKENFGTTLKLGVAFAEHYSGPYKRLSPDPIFDFGLEKNKGVEDAYVWWVDDHYEAIMKDMTGAICGERHGGIHGWSRDGVEWHVSDPPKAYSKTVQWSDGTVTTQGQFERPQLLIEDGRPTHLFVATGDGPGGFRNMTHCWNMVVPLDQ